MYGASDVGTCVKCGQSGKHIMGICFNELEGEPFICSQCIFEFFTTPTPFSVETAFGGKRPAWNTGFDPTK